MKFFNVKHLDSFHVNIDKFDKVNRYSRFQLSTMTSTVQQSKNAVTLRGSAAIISEFFNYGINSILYQRGIYPPESFTRFFRFDIQGLTLLIRVGNKNMD